jgi:hypothetical protein
MPQPIMMAQPQGGYLSIYSGGGSPHLQMINEARLGFGGYGGSLYGSGFFDYGNHENGQYDAANGGMIDDIRAIGRFFRNLFGIKQNAPKAIIEPGEGIFYFPGDIEKVEEEFDDSSFTAMDGVRAAADILPIVGSVWDINDGIRDGNGWQVAMGVGFLALDVATLGSGSLVKGALKTGFKQASKSIFREASEAALKAVKNKNIFIKNKHLNFSTGKYAKFDTNSVETAQDIVSEAISSPNAMFFNNPNLENTFRIQTDLGRVIGTKGETSVRAIMGYDGAVINAFPIK